MKFSFKIKAVILLLSFLFLLDSSSYAQLKKSSSLQLHDGIKVMALDSESNASIPDDWELHYFGCTGLDPNALAPNERGLTYFQCYLQGIDPTQPPPDETFTVSVVATGPYRAPANVELVASVTHPTNTTVSKIEFYNWTPNGETILGTITDPPYEFACQNVLVGTYLIVAKASDSAGAVVSAATEFEVVPSNRYNRGYGNDQKYISSIIAVDNEQGDFLDRISNFSSLYGTNYPWFLRAASDPSLPCQHIYNGPDHPVNYPDTPYFQANYLPILDGNSVGGEPPMIAFGSSSKQGAPLFINQDYHFGIIAGEPVPVSGLKVDVYEKSAFENGATNVEPAITKTYNIPYMSHMDDWNMFKEQFYVQDYHLATNINGKLVDFDTKLQYQTGLNETSWLNTNSSPLPFVLTHRSANDLFCYKISIKGLFPISNDSLNARAMALQVYPDGTQEDAYNLTYALDFDTPASWSATILHLPQFQGSPIPSGISIDELLHNAPLVQDSLFPPDSNKITEFTQLNNSPELKTHPILDQFVSDLKNDPIAIANFVQNEIELTDAIGYNITGNSDPTSINSQGVMRDALGTYLEGQGSPIEQCALLIYLLRKAGVPATYVFPDYNGTQMYDEQLSRMLHMQLRGTTTLTGIPAGLPELIPVNYPWVAAFIGGKWVHLFPWIKDTEVVEGMDIWSYFPTGYKTGPEWLYQYLINDPTIRSLSKEDNPGTLFPLYAAKQLQPNNLTIDDVGMKFFNHRQDYTVNNNDWSNFPRPWKTPLISSNNIKSNLDDNFFDTIQIQVFSDPNQNGPSDLGKLKLLMDTGDLHFVDLHDRRLLLYHQIVTNTMPPQYNVILSLEAYDSTPGSSDTTSYTFKSTNSIINTNPDPGDLRAPQKLGAILQTAANPGDPNDDALFYRISCSHHKQAAAANLNYLAQFPTLEEIDSTVDMRSLRKGDMAALSLDYGRITDAMKNFELKKYLDYQRSIAADPTMPSDPELATGQLLQLMGKTYYYHVCKFQEQIEDLTKVHTVSFRAHGLTKFSPEYGMYGPITTVNNRVLDFNLLYPKVDMGFQKAVVAGNASAHLESGNNSLQDIQTLQLVNGEVSAQEHRIINEFFNQASAVSTVKLLDIAQGWTPETGKAAQAGTNNILILNMNNYLDEEGKSFSAYPEDQSEVNGFVEMWNNITAFFDNNKNDSFATVLMTPQAMTAPGQIGIPYTGMGAFALSLTTAAAWITDRMEIANGAFGQPVAIPIESNDPYALNNIISPTPNGGFSLTQSSPQDNWSSTQTFVQPVVSVQHFDTTDNQVSSENQALMPDLFSSISAWDLLSKAIGAPIDPATLSNTGSQISTLWAGQINSGYLGNTSIYTQSKETLQKEIGKFLFDPVSVVTGEFYVNALDLKLNGPMPLEMRRIYGSQNQANNNFSYGWRLGYFPYLMLSHDSETTPALIYAAETDGSVIAYRYQSDTKIWIPTPADNPDLVNNNDASGLSSANLFNNRITQNITASSTNYFLTGADQSIRNFTVRSFPIIGSQKINRTRPYLDTWSDTQGNSYTFSFGTNNMANDFGELNAIDSNNGSSLHFYYDPYSHITDAVASDGRHLKYNYDAYGDLIQVTLPDASVINYGYKHAKTKLPSASTDSAATTITPDTIYSTHLLTQEIKPNGRIIQNDYDKQRRVVTQLSTVGTSTVPIKTAAFNYSTSTNSDNTISGKTTVKDVNGNETKYTISNSQIANIAYPNKTSISQTWDSAARTLTSRTDRRGLITSYSYDGQGNLTSRTLTGNITGSGNGTATTSFSYNANNLLTSLTDPVNSAINYGYSDTAHSHNPTSITKTSSGKITSSTTLTYGNFGLLASSTTDNASTSYSYDGHGFLTSMTQSTGTADPAITTTITTDRRGEIVSEVNSIGQKKTYTYDAMGRRTGDETFDKTGSPVDWHFNQYNANGDLQWEQGARFNPVDKTCYDYDRAGHLLHKMAWLSDGTQATTAYTYDSYGNLTSIVDPNGHTTSMGYDSLGEMTSRTSGDGIVLESFTPESGGQVATHSTILGGIESNIYTSTGQLQLASYADGTTSSYLYDLSERLVQEKFPNNTICNISYDGNTVTRTFCDNSENSLGSTSETYDSRGNRTAWSDLAGNQFSATYDGLNRIKTEQGPAASGNSAAQTKTHSYKPGSESIVNGVNERTDKFFDALGRPVLTTLFNSDGSVASNISNLYAPDHQSVTTTVGTGNNAIVNTVTTDTFGHPILLQHGDGSFQVTTYDANGNKTSFRDEEGNTTTWSYDALNHLASETLPGGATTTYSCNPAGELLTRSMPQGLVEQNGYDTAGHKTSDALIGSDGNATRNHTYVYTAGVLSSIIDPRGFTTAIQYDGWQHPTNVTSGGSSVPEQNQITSCTYDPRGLLTSVAQSYADPSTGSSTKVSRGYDAYGQLIFESTSLNGTPVSSWKEAWNGAGRRTALNWILDDQGTGAQYSFSYNALGLLTTAANITGVCSYAYGDNGLVSSSSTPFDATLIARDNRGHIGEEGVIRKSDNALLFHEYMGWSPKGILQNYNVLANALGVPTEARNYVYDERGRLTQEPYLMVNSPDTNKLSNESQTARYFFDENPLSNPLGGTENGLGIRTTQYVNLDEANRVFSENSFSQVTQDNCFDVINNNNWIFSVYDRAGEVEGRSISNKMSDDLTWDSFGRLVKITQRGNNNDYDWSTTYDGLGRRINTFYQTTTGSGTMSYYYDPEVEFLELGHSINGSRTWNLYGPDRSGTYGGAQGIGGLECGFFEDSTFAYGHVKNLFGDIVGICNGGSTFTYPSILGGYGPMPGSTVNTNFQPQWRGHYLDWTGFYYMGARYYEPNSGRFLSADPLGHDASMDLYSYCNGDPVNGLDPDGRDAVPQGGGWNSFVNENEFLINFAVGQTVFNPRPLCSGQCATTAQYLIGSYDKQGIYHDAPSASTWVEGGNVDKFTPYGTLIAMGWQNGRYPNLSPDKYHAIYGATANVNHTGIFEGIDSNNGNLLVLDASKGIPIALDSHDPTTTDWHIVLSKDNMDPKPSTSSLQYPEPTAKGACGN